MNLQRFLGTGEKPDETTELLAVLSELISNLRKDERKELSFWADWLEQSRNTIVARDFSGIEHLLRAYGGMGSINDFFATPEQDRLLGQAHELASAIRRDHESPSNDG